MARLPVNVAKPALPVRDAIEQATRGSSYRAEVARKILAREVDRAGRHTQLIRLGISSPTPIRYATTAAPSEWVTCDAASQLISAILAAVRDGRDRMILSWPRRACNGFVAASLAAREAQASGSLA